MSVKEKVFAVAPMMEWTDRHYRYLARLMSKHTRLYTEMITSGALIHGDRDRFLKYDDCEHPIALQLGGSNPADMKQSAIWGEQAGYDEININVGCPSDRVQSGKFGVCLMREPELVASCVQEMADVTTIPITVKCRIGVDNDDSYEFLTSFIDKVELAGCNTFVLHARKAWLTGLNPKQNREIPELDYQRVYKLKQDYPHLNIWINGGIDSMADVKKHLENVDGVMMGRHAYKHPHFLMSIDQEIFNDQTNAYSSSEDIILKYIKYIEDNIRVGVPLNAMTKHILNLYQGVAGARVWRRHLSENMHKSGAGVNVIYDALEKLNKVAI